MRYYCCSAPQYLSHKSRGTLGKVKVAVQQKLRFLEAAGPALSRLAAEEKNGLFAEKVPEPPGRVESQRRPPGVERHRLLHLHANRRAQLAEILDRAVVDVGRVVPAVRQDVGLRHVSGEQKLQPHFPVTEIRK